MNKCIILGGGTFTEAKCHLALAAPAFGNTARQLHNICVRGLTGFDIQLILTKMADHASDIITNTDLYWKVNSLIEDKSVKVIIFNAAVCDFYLEGLPDVGRLKSSGNVPATLIGESCKFISLIKERRPDIFVVGFKTTFGETVEVQKQLAYNQIHNSNVDIVLANDLSTRNNLVVVKKGGAYENDRQALLEMLPTLIKAGTLTGSKFETFKCFQ